MTAKPHIFMPDLPVSGIERRQFVARGWGFFRSMRLALMLIFALAGVVFIGTVIEQAPPTVAADPSAYAQWVERVSERYGGWTETFERLQFFTIFHSFYFRLLLGLLLINIVVCTASRSRAIWTSVFHVRVRATERFLAHARYRAVFEVDRPAAEVAEQSRRALRKVGYHVRREPGDDAIALFGDKNRFSRFATLLTHLSIVLLLAGAMVGGVWGFKDPQFVVAEGSTSDLGLGTGLALRLDEFADEYHADGVAKDFRSEVTLFKNGRPVKAAAIRVNAPLRYHGISFHQLDFGQAAVITIRNASGAVIANESVPLAWQTANGGRPIGVLEIPGEKLTIHLTGPRTGTVDPLIPAGAMQVELFRSGVKIASSALLVQGRPSGFGDLAVTFEREGRYAQFQVVKAPGLTIIWVASALMVAGLVMLFWFPRRSVWLLCREGPEGRATIHLGMPCPREALSVSEEFERLCARVERSLVGAGASPRGRREP